MAIKPKSERFADNRVDRFAHCGRHAGSRRSLRNIHIEQSKVHSKLFKAVREDKRFAAPVLFHALSRTRHTSYFATYFERLKSELGFGRFACDIPIAPEVYFLTAAHKSESDELKIACYPTRRDAARSREVVMTPGRFFRGVYANESDAFIQTMTEEYLAHFRPVVIHYADDADTWAAIYSGDTNVRSCMSGFNARAYDHPARFYVYPDNGLRLAYITDGDSPDDTVVARAIVNVDRMAYVRVYGDARLARALESAGFEEDAYRALEGVRCAARTNDNGQLIAPYIDGPGALDWNGGDYCTINKYGSMDATSQNGYIGYANHCDDCGDGYDDDSGAFSEYHQVSICDACANANYTYAYTSAGRYPSRDLIRDDEVVYIGGENYVNDPDVLFAAGFVCDIDGDWQDIDDCVYLERHGEYVHMDYVVKLDVDSDEGDEYALKSDTIIIVLNGEELRVSDDYDGMTDDKARRMARHKVKTRAYSRGAQGKRQRAIRAAKRARYYRAIVESAV